MPKTSRCRPRGSERGGLAAALVGYGAGRVPAIAGWATHERAQAESQAGLRSRNSRLVQMAGPWCLPYFPRGCLLSDMFTGRALPRPAAKGGLHGWPMIKSRIATKRSGKLRARKKGIRTPDLFRQSPRVCDLRCKPGHGTGCYTTGQAAVDDLVLPPHRRIIPTAEDLPPTQSPHRRRRRRIQPPDQAAAFFYFSVLAVVSIGPWPSARRPGHRTSGVAAVRSRDSRRNSRRLCWSGLFSPKVSETAEHLRRCLRRPRA